ncbi:MAG: hypothetical protein GXP53_12455 [Deltaproteobacteria bacterium]|nr:hypothetical protein [Deltaproteobacteria bacterium]
MKEKTDISKLNIPEDTDRAIRLALNEKAADGRIPCASVFKILESIGIAPDIAGAYADLMGLKIIGCQLGLFGGHGKKKDILPMEKVPEALESAIREELKDGRIPCATAWDIAARMSLTKIKVSGACEAMGVKIKPCQLGAF